MTSFLILAGACGKAGSPAGSFYREQLKTDGSNVSGSYSATLYPMNINLHAPKAGMASFIRKGDELTVKVKLDVGARGASYRQAVYWGNHCPGMEVDYNKDGYLDMTEMESALGDVIIPLDGDIDSQSEGTGRYPSGNNPRGSYFYKQTASFSRFFEDLRADDPNPNDRVRKLEDQMGFTFIGKVVIIQGATSDFKIPDTVSSYYGLSRVSSLPIACGIIFKAKDTIADEAPTPLVSGDEPNDSRPVPTPDTDPVPAPQPDPTPAPDTTTPTDTHPHPAPTSTGNTDGHHDDSDSDGGVIGSIRDWWNHVTGGGGGGH